jgi:hypothetical protein
LGIRGATRDGRRSRDPPARRSRPAPPAAGRCSGRSPSPRTCAACQCPRAWGTRPAGPRSGSGSCPCTGGTPALRGRVRGQRFARQARGRGRARQVAPVGLTLPGLGDHGRREDDHPGGAHVGGRGAGVSRGPNKTGWGSLNWAKPRTGNLPTPVSPRHPCRPSESAPGAGVSTGEGPAGPPARPCMARRARSVYYTERCSPGAQPWRCSPGDQPWRARTAGAAEATQQLVRQPTLSWRAPTPGSTTPSSSTAPARPTFRPRRC